MSKIVFGWYSFTIKSFDPKELGIENENANDNIRLEVRQKCAHLMFIPFLIL